METPIPLSLWLRDYQGTYLGNWKHRKRGLWEAGKEVDFQCLSLEVVAVIVEL